MGQAWISEKSEMWDPDSILDPSGGNLYSMLPYSQPSNLLETFTKKTAILGFDPRSHLANFHANAAAAAATTQPTQVQLQNDIKNKALRNTGLKLQTQVSNNEFGTGRNLLVATLPNASFSNIDTSKVPLGTAEKQNNGNMKDKLWPCPSCKVPFKAASELQVHLSAHTKGERTVPCQICGKYFVSLERVRIHIRAAHGEKSCSCDICGSGFSYRCKLLDHMRTHTGDKPFHCDVCGKFFSQKNHLTRHSMIHTGERPYPCDFCGRGFYRKDKLTRHRRIHTGEKPYTCLTCGESFYRKDKLTGHIKMHAGENPASCGIPGKFLDDKNLKNLNTLNTCQLPVSSAQPPNHNTGLCPTGNNNSGGNANNSAAPGTSGGPNGGNIKHESNPTPNPSTSTASPSPSLSPSPNQFASLPYKRDWQNPNPGVH